MAYFTSNWLYDAPLKYLKQVSATRRSNVAILHFIVPLSYDYLFLLIHKRNWQQSK